MYITSILQFCKLWIKRDYGIVATWLRHSCNNGDSCNVSDIFATYRAFLQRSLGHFYCFQKTIFSVMRLGSGVGYILIETSNSYLKSIKGPKVTFWTNCVFPLINHKFMIKRRWNEFGLEGKSPLLFLCKRNRYSLITTRNDCYSEADCFTGKLSYYFIIISY